MQKNPPGYPLPSGELGDDDIACQLVYLPDRDEYWQALYGAIAYFATWIAWERDVDKRGADAAANWREALELTTECWRMTCLDDLKSDVADILLVLQGKKDCCDDNITYIPGDDPTTEIEPNTGDPPDNYGETSIEDWDEWTAHVCYNAHRYVDQLVITAEGLANEGTKAAMNIGIVAAFLAALVFFPIGLPVYFGFASTVLLLVAAASLGAFQDAASDIETGRGEIVCAIVSGTSLSEVMEDVLGSLSEEWLLFFKWVPYDAAIAIIYEGGWDGDYLPTTTSQECCEPILVYAVGGSGSQCATYDKDGAYRIPSSGYASSYTAYQHTHGCNDLGYAGTVLRLRFSDDADAVTGRSVRVWVTDYDLTGGIGGQYPNALEFYNPSVGLIQAITHANFVEGAFYTDDNVAYIIVMAGELGGATLNWEFTV